LVELLGFLAFILAPVAFFMSLGARSRIDELERLRQERDLKLDDLLERVARIERQVRNLGPRPETTLGPSQAPEPAPPAAELPQPPALPDEVPSVEPASVDATIPEPLPPGETTKRLPSTSGDSLISQRGLFPPYSFRMFLLHTREPSRSRKQARSPFSGST